MTAAIDARARITLVGLTLVGVFAACAHPSLSDLAAGESSASLRRPASVGQEIRGGDAGSMLPSPLGPAVVDPEKYDAVVIGGGLAGLASAFYLTKAGKRVLLLDKEARFGGLAAWGDRNDGAASKSRRYSYGRGAAYWTEASEEEKQILNDIGFKGYEKKFAITEPIDSYFVRGRFYAGIWDSETLERLPASFALFKFELQRTDAEGLIPSQPFEEFEAYHGRMDLDGFTAQTWIEGMPEAMKKHVEKLAAEAAGPGDQSADARKRHAEAKAIYERYLEELADGKLRGPTGMLDVVELANLYCRSALGSTTRLISAMAFANFYISEISTRYTTMGGTGGVAESMVKLLSKRPRSVLTVKTEAPAIKIANAPDHVEVTYNFKGRTHRVRAAYAVFASQLMLAPMMIEGFAERAPEQAGLMSSLMYAHYLVHVVHVEGHPYRATYDTWTYPSDYSEDDFTDLINGRWMDPKMPGYAGYRDFAKEPPDQDGVLSIYQPLSGEWAARALNDGEVKGLADRALARLESEYSRLPPEIWKGPLKVKEVETNRWPFSVHLVRPGFFTKSAKILRRPFGRVLFGNNNLGAPAFEEALFRGHCAAVNVLHRLDPRYKREDWSRCPLD